MALTGDPLVATAWAFDSQRPDGTTTSTGYTATLTGGTACGVAFVAPPSGAVCVLSSMEINNTNGASFSLATVRVRTGGVVGSGSDVLAADDNNGLFGVGDNRRGVHKVVSGLTPGATYNAQQLFRVTANTGTFGRKDLAVVPVI